MSRCAQRSPHLDAVDAPGTAGPSAVYDRTNRPSTERPYVIVDTLRISPTEFNTKSGWELKPEGLCKGVECVPLPPGGVAANGDLELPVVAERLAMPMVEDGDAGIWALGPRGGGRALETAEAAPLTLPDVDGNPFSLQSLHGRKVLLVAWASW